MEDDLRPRIRAVVGLGNPGRDFDRTRHNLGFEVVDFLKGNSRFIAGDGKFFRCDILISSLSVVLLKPTTYMNRSGIAVSKFAESEDLSTAEILIVTDDFHLPFGRIRVRRVGSDGGHNGLASVIYHLGSEEFPRIRLGIGPVREGVPSEEFVLERFSGSEIRVVDQMVERAAQAVSSMIREGFEKTAALYNRP